MRTMMRISIPVGNGNKGIQDGSLPRVIQTTLEALKPEAAYFFTEAGKRTALVVFDLQDPSQIPVVCEPLFMGLDASIDLLPVMNAQDLQAGLGQLGKS